jgi:TonB family protein
MSHTPAHTKDSASPRERRLHIRQPVSSLAYLDVDEDNGGIVLNLSEVGMAFQAVGPLERQARVSLRIQVPHSQAQIDTAAHVVWLSESRRHVGVRFVDMPSEARVQVQEWLRSEISAGTLSENAPKQRKNVSEPPRTDEADQKRRANKWPASLPKYPELQPDGEALPPISAIPERTRVAPAEQKTAEAFTRPGSASVRLGEGTSSPHGALDQPPTENPTLGPDARLNGPDNGSPIPDFRDRSRAESEIFLRWPTSSSLTVPSAAAEPPAPPPTFAAPTPFDIDSDTEPAPLVSDTSSPDPKAPRRKQARKWAGIAMVLALFSLLSFGVGTWIGSMRKHVPSAPSPKETAAAVAVRESGTNATKKRHAIKLPTAISRKPRTEDAKSNPAPTNQEITPLPKRPLLALPLDQDVPSKPMTQSLTPPTVAKPTETSSARAPLLRDSAPAAPAPNMVAGRALRPTDRFNPCHLSYRVEPTYPEAAQQQHIEGAVKIHLVIGADGTVRSMKLLSGSPLLAPAAMEAARYWRYLPALLNGQPVETQQDIEIDFHLPR